MTIRRRTAPKKASCGSVQAHLGRFAAIDFETADVWRDSACSLGIVVVQGFKIVSRNYFLIRPPRRRFMFSHLHGITWGNVANKPRFRDVWPEALKLLEGASFIAAHCAPFDRSVLYECCDTSGLTRPELGFLCTLELSRDTWGIFPTKLPDVCRRLQIPLQHHHAESDALACANIVIAAVKKRGARLVFPQL